MQTFYPNAHTGVNSRTRSRIGLKRYGARKGRMNIPSILHAIMAATGMNQTALGEALGVKQSSVSRWTKGSDPGTEMGQRIFALANKHGIVTDTLNPAHIRSTVQIKGLVGLGDQVEWHGDGDGENDLGQVEVPFPLEQGCVALEARGESMAPRVKNGELVIVRRFDGDFSSALNEDAVIKVTEGPYLLKTLRKGYTAGFYNLHSVTGAVMEDRAIDWVAELVAIIPRRQWKKMTRD